VGLLENGDWVKPVTDRRSVVGGLRSGTSQIADLRFQRGLWTMGPRNMGLGTRVSKGRV